jgi:hypothetical protein
MKQLETNNVQLSDEALQKIVESLSKSVKPRVLYRPDHHQMTEEALEICQQNARAVLKMLQESLPPGHCLVLEIMQVLDEAVEIWDRYPF